MKFSKKEEATELTAQWVKEGQLIETLGDVQRG